MKNLLIAITVSLSLSACGPRTLNQGQREYLIEDAVKGASRTAEIAASIFATEFFYDTTTVDPSLTAAQNAARIAGHVEAAVAGCESGIVSYTDGGEDLVVSWRCSLAGVSSSALVFVDVATQGAGISVTFDFGISGSRNGVPFANTLIARFNAATVSLDVETDIPDQLRFSGAPLLTPTSNDLVLSGSGVWGDGAFDPEVPVRFEGVSLTRTACAPHVGTVTFGPRDVLVTEHESIPVDPAVIFKTTTPQQGDVSVDLDGSVHDAQLTLPDGCSAS